MGLLRKKITSSKDRPSMSKKPATPKRLKLFGATFEQGAEVLWDRELTYTRFVVHHRGPVHAASSSATRRNGRKELRLRAEPSVLPWRNPYVPGVGWE